MALPGVLCTTREGGSLTLLILYLINSLDPATMLELGDADFDYWTSVFKIANIASHLH
jgi:hypothetical protein